MLTIEKIGRQHLSVFVRIFLTYVAYSTDEIIFRNLERSLLRNFAYTRVHITAITLGVDDKEPIVIDGEPDSARPGRSHCLYV